MSSSFDQALCRQFYSTLKLIKYIVYSAPSLNLLINPRILRLRVLAG